MSGWLLAPERIERPGPPLAVRLDWVGDRWELTVADCLRLAEGPVIQECHPTDTAADGPLGFVGRSGTRHFGGVIVPTSDGVRIEVADVSREPTDGAALVLAWASERSSGRFRLEAWVPARPGGTALATADGFVFRGPAGPLPAGTREYGVWIRRAP